ncbi:hypothetical protein AB1Y20_003942 [Prymnesium parvum]
MHRRWLPMACLFVATTLLWRLTSPPPPAADPPPPSPRRRPPLPYTYASTLEWLRTANLSEALAGASWRPSLDEFDLDAARHGKWGAWLRDDEPVFAAAKAVNRWLFLEPLFYSGGRGSTAAAPMHLYILHALRPAAAASRTPTLLDAGCGVGFLLQAWLLLAGEGARAVGVDIDSRAVAAARRHLSSAHALAAGVARPRRTRVEVRRGDALAPPPTLLRDGEADAVNVGLAVEGVGALRGLRRVLRVGGRLAAPLCAAAQPADVPAGMCVARFTVMSKGEDGELYPLPSDPGVEVRFIKAMTPETFPPPELELQRKLKRAMAHRLIVS